MGKTRYFRAYVEFYDEDYGDYGREACCGKWHTSWQSAQACGEDKQRRLWCGGSSVQLVEKT